MTDQLLDRKSAKKTAKKATRKGKAKKKTGDLIISKARTKATAGINVSGDFYGALDENKNFTE